MTTQTRERDLETKQGVVQTIDLPQMVVGGSLATSTLQVRSEAKIACQAIPDQRDGSLASRSITKVLVGFANRLAVVYDLLVAPPATERGRISNAMVRAKHDRFISFLR